MNAYPCIICGHPTASEFMVCQKNPACRKEFHRRADRPKATKIEVLASIFALTCPGMQRSVAMDIAVAMSKKDRNSVTVALERFASILAVATMPPGTSTDVSGERYGEMCPAGRLEQNKVAFGENHGK